MKNTFRDRGGTLVTGRSNAHSTMAMQSLTLTNNGTQAPLLHSGAFHLWLSPSQKD